MPQLPVNGELTAVFFRVQNNSVVGAFIEYQVTGSRTPLTVPFDSDAADLQVVQDAIGAMAAQLSVQNTALTEEIANLQSQISSVPGLQAQIATLQSEKAALQAQLDAILNPSTPARNWDVLYAQSLVSQVFGHINQVAKAPDSPSALQTAYTDLGLALTQGEKLERLATGAGLAALQSSIDGLLSLVPLSPELLAELRGLLDANGFEAIAI